MINNCREDKIKKILEEGISCRQYMLGMQDTFGRSGKPKELLDYYGLDAKHIAEKIKEITEK